MRRHGLEAVVMMMVGLNVVGVVAGFLLLVLVAAELCLGVSSSECAVVMRRLRSEMSGSSGLGQREDVAMVLRPQS